eukprot:4693036-Pyramimonas_sp.AAC.1
MRAGPHYQRIQNRGNKARALRMSMVLVVPPGYFWKQSPMRDAMKISTCRSCVCDAAVSF